MSTIVAIATPPGRGGVGIVRVSGPDARSYALKIIQRIDLTPRQAHYLSFYALDGSLLDQGLVLYFKAPHSFTGEDVIEFQCHGAPVVLDMLIQTLLHLGAVLAKPGEFSERAFLNDKMDLTQAEAIADLIHASSQAAARMALRSLQGDFSKQITLLSEQLIYLRLYVEAAIDFSDEELDLLHDEKIFGILFDLQQNLTKIKAVAAQGVIMREGLVLVIAGRPNAGKSTLLNCLAKREVAIVSPQPGTTRDLMHEHIVLDGIPLHVIDTAGLRQSTDAIEIEGMKRAWAELRRADVVLMMIDSTEEHQSEQLSAEIKAALPDAVPMLLVYNKIDVLGMVCQKTDEAVYLSLQTGDGLPLLMDAIKTMVGYAPCEGQFLARQRHLDALNQAQAALAQGQRLLSEHRALELLAEDLRLAHRVLGEITGEFSSDDLLGVIFSNFCIGK